MGTAMLFLGEGRRRVEAGKEGLAPIQLLLLPLLLAVNAVAMDCSRFPMWDACRGAAAFSSGGQEQLLPEKRGSRGLIMQRPSGPPLPWMSSGWQTGYKKIPYLPVYPHFGQQGVSINDPRRSSQGLSIFDPRGKKASPLRRNGNHLFSTIIRKQAGGL